MKKLVLASGNAGKLRELSVILDDLGYQLHAQAEYGVSEVAETGTTFVENAIIKARHAASLTGLPALADDSGIEVDALDGAPGVYSARFSGPAADDAANNALLVERLQAVPAAERSARYRAVIVFMRHAADPSPLICEGSWEGMIQLQPAGEGGFGYDPYFFLPELGCTSAELSAPEKNRISHRGMALVELKKKLREQRCLAAIHRLAFTYTFPGVKKSAPIAISTRTRSDSIPQQAYVDALLDDLAQDLPLIWGRRIESIFIGGGTPSLFSAESIDRLFSGLRSLINFAPAIEVTMESNPGSAEAANYRGYREAGVNRLSIGIQSFDNERLALLGRVHDKAQALQAFQLARDAGFDNINLDLMFGLPGQSLSPQQIRPGTGN